MEKTIVSFESVLAEAKTSGMQQVALPFKTFTVNTAEVRPFMKSLVEGKTASGRPTKAFNVQGFTLKFDATLSDAVATSDTLTIGFFQSDIEQADKTMKSISWIRIIACD